MSNTAFSLGNKLVGVGQPCLIIGEVAQAHDGSLGMVHAFIDAIANTGAGAVKFQTHIAKAESTPAEPWRVKFSQQDATRMDYWRRMEFTEEQWSGIKQHAEDRGMLFISSPFSIEAADLLARLDMKIWKIASGEVNNTLLFDRILTTGRPVLFSTGVSPMVEVDNVVDKLETSSIPYVVMQCTTAYPCPPEKIGLNMISVYRERYKGCVGLSDHSGTIYAALAAATIGIEALEIHVALSREMFGPDVVASVTTTELRQLVEGVRFIERMKASSVDKNQMAAELLPIRNLFTKSVVAAIDLPAGTILKKQHLELKKPGIGVPADKINDLLGKRLKRSLVSDEIIDWADFDH